MRIKKHEFIERYTGWLQKHLQEVLPPEASEFRMVEITRRQHHHDVNHLLTMMKGGDDVGKENVESSAV